MKKAGAEIALVLLLVLLSVPTGLASAPPLQKPMMPTPEGFALTTAVSGVSLSWNVPAAMKQMVVWRASSEEGPWFIRDVVPSEPGVYLDEDISALNEYFYHIQGFDGEKLSAFSETLSVIVTYDNDAVVVSDADKALFENEDSYLDESLPYDEYERRLKLANQKTYCDVLSRANGASLDADVQSLSDCGGIARVLDVGEATNRDRQQALPAAPSEGSGGKDFAIGGGTGGARGKNSGGNGGGGTGAGGGGSPRGAGGKGGNGAADASGAGTAGAVQAGIGDQCDATFRRVYGHLRDCRPRTKDYLEQEKDELELMKLELEELMKSLLIAEDDNETLLSKKQQYELLTDAYLTKRSRYEDAQRKVLYNRGLALEQFGMEFQRRGDGKKALQAFEDARAACLPVVKMTAFEEDAYAARLCAARNALKHAMILGPRDLMLQDAQREYQVLAQEIEALTDATQKKKFLPLAVEAYAGLVHAEIREGKFSVADSALKLAERLDPDGILVKHMRKQYEQALVDMIAINLEQSSAEAYYLLDRKLRMDESLGKVAATSGPGKLISSFTLEKLTDKATQEQLKLTDEQLGMTLVKKAMLRGKSLKEIQAMDDVELAVLFGTSDVQRAAKAGTLMRKAFGNVDVQKYVNGEAGGFVFETGRSYFNAAIKDQLDDDPERAKSIFEFWLRKSGQISDDMFSIEGVAMNLLPFAQLSGKVGLLSKSGKLLKGAELWKASSAGETTSAIGAVFAGAKQVIPGLERAGAGIHNAFAASRFGSAAGAFVARHPNTLVVLGAVEGALIGIGGTQIVEHYSLGSGIIFGTITGEFSPLAHLGGSAAAASRAGIRTVTGNSALKNNGITMTKSSETKRYTPVLAPEAGAKGMHDTTVFYDSRTGDIVGTSQRTAFDAHGNAIPIIEFADRASMNQYVFGMEARDHGLYRAQDGSLFLPYVKGRELPKVLPDADANSILITGQKKGGLFGVGKGGRAERFMIEALARDSELGVLSQGLAVTGERVYHAPDAPEAQVYLQKVGEEVGIKGASDNALIVRESQNAMREALLTRPMVVRGSIVKEQGYCSGGCGSQELVPWGMSTWDYIDADVAQDPSKYRIFPDALKTEASKLNNERAERKLWSAIDYLDKLGVSTYVHPHAKQEAARGMLRKAGVFTQERLFDDPITFYHEADHAIFLNRYRTYLGLVPTKPRGAGGISFAEGFDFLNTPNRLYKDQRIPMWYHTPTKRLLFLNEVHSQGEMMFTEVNLYDGPLMRSSAISERDLLPVEVSFMAAFEYNAYTEADIRLSNILGNDRSHIFYGGLEAIETGRDDSAAVLMKIFKEHSESIGYSLLDWKIKFLDKEEISLLRSFEDTSLRNALSTNDASFSVFRKQKIDALHHLDLVEQNGIPAGVLPEAIPRVRQILVEQLAPHQNKMSDRHKAIFERAAKKVDVQASAPDSSGRSLLTGCATGGCKAPGVPPVSPQSKLTAQELANRQALDALANADGYIRLGNLLAPAEVDGKALKFWTDAASGKIVAGYGDKGVEVALLLKGDAAAVVAFKQQLGAKGTELPRGFTLIQEPKQELFTIQRRDALIGKHADAATQITSKTVDALFGYQYDPSRNLFGAKAVAYRDTLGDIHVRFWNSGDGSNRDVHHQDGLADLLLAESKGLEKLARQTGDMSFHAQAVERSGSASFISSMRQPSLIYDDALMRNALGFQFTRAADGRIVSFDIDSSITHTQIVRGIVLEGNHVSTMITRVHESISPELRGYTVIRIDASQGELKIDGNLELPDGLRLVNLQQNPL